MVLPSRLGSRSRSYRARAQDPTAPSIRLTPGFLAMSAITIFVGLLVLFPLSMLLFGSFWTARPGFDGSLTLNNYIKAYSDVGTYRVFGTTLLLMGAKTILAVIFAVTMAWIVTRTDTPMRGMLEVLPHPPNLRPGIARGHRLDPAAQPKHGVLNVFLRNLFGLSDHPSISIAWAACCGCCP